MKRRRAWVTVDNGTRWPVYRVGPAVYVGTHPVETYPRDVQARAMDALKEVEG